MTRTTWPIVCLLIDRRTYIHQKCWGNSTCNCSAVVNCDQGLIWHGGQEGVKLAGSRNVRTPCKCMKFPGDERRNSLSIVLQPFWNGNCWGAPFGQQSRPGRWAHSWLKCPMLMFSGLVLQVQRCTRNLPMMPFCRLHVEPGLYPMHCSFYFSFLFKHRSILKFALRNTTKILQQELQ